MTSLARAIQIMQAAGHDWVPVKIAKLKGTKMATKSVGKVKLKTDAKGKTRLTRVHTYDASKSRKIAKSKTKRVVAPARAAARGR